MKYHDDLEIHKASCLSWGAHSLPEETNMNKITGDVTGKCFRITEQRKRPVNSLDHLAEGEGNLLGFSFSETTYSAALFQNYRFWSELLQPKPIRSWVLHANTKPFCFVLLVLYFPSFILLFSSEKKVKEVKIFFESGFSEFWPCSRDDKI